MGGAWAARPGRLGRFRRWSSSFFLGLGWRWFSVFHVICFFGFKLCHSCVCFFSGEGGFSLRLPLCWGGFGFVRAVESHFLVLGKRVFSCWSAMLSTSILLVFVWSPMFWELGVVVFLHTWGGCPLTNITGKGVLAFSQSLTCLVFSLCSLERATCVPFWGDVLGRI